MSLLLEEAKVVELCLAQQFSNFTVYIIQCLFVTFSFALMGLVLPFACLHTLLSRVPLVPIT